MSSMNYSLPSLTQSLLIMDSTSSEWHSTIDRIVEAVLKGRKIAKQHSKQPLDDVYRLLYADLKLALTSAVVQAAESDRAKLSLSADGLKGLLNQSYRQVLTYERLTQLAVHLQKQPFRSSVWQTALNELFTAVYLSNKLKRPVTHGKADTVLDITNEALMQAIKDIQKFDPSRAHFIGWLNQVYIGKRGIDIRNRQKDTLEKSHHRRVMPIKYSLKGIFARSQTVACRWHLIFYLKCSETRDRQSVCLLLSLVICLLQRQIQDDAVTGDRLLFVMAEAVTGRSVEFDSLDVPIRNKDGSGQAKDLAAPVPDMPPKVDFLRDCLQHESLTSCEDILQKCIKQNPQATLRAIALQRIEGRTLKEIGQAFDVLIPTVQKFYERNMTKVADCLKRCVEDKLSLWEMQHPQS